MDKPIKTDNNDVKIIDSKDIEVVKPKHVGRPYVYDPGKLAIAFNDYIDNEDYPLVTSFCLMPGNPSKKQLYEIIARDSEDVNCQALGNALKRCLDKQEDFVERQVSIGKFNPIFAIFKLKQPAFGWKDKVETENNTKIQLEIMLPSDVKKLSK